jgi:hypothetical protein
MAVSPPAPAHTQARRLSFALTGLPPVALGLPEPRDGKSYGEAEWSGLAERALASPHHGERLAMWWLDAARYSDSDGYQQDATRTNWPWRDWVARAFNNNMPFDRFTLEQFAGDLLPDAGPEQILATCFHRNHMTNGEGGRDPEESRMDYVIDRVNTTGTVWLGLTLGCTQCHDHKFDPVSQRDYYSLSAFFNSIDEDGKAGAGAKPFLKYTAPGVDASVAEAAALAAKWAERESRARKEAESRFEARLKRLSRELKPDYLAWRRVEPEALASVEGTVLVLEPDGSVRATGPNPRQDDYRVRFTLPAGVERLTGWRLEVLPHPEHTGGGLSRGASGEFTLTNVKLLLRRRGESQVREIAMRGAVADVEKEVKARTYGRVADTLDDDPRNGWTTESADPKSPHTAVFELEEPLRLAADETLELLMLHRSTHGDENIGRFRLAVSDEAGETVRKLGGSPLEELARLSGVGKASAVDAALRGRLLEQFLLDDAAFQQVRARHESAKAQLAETRKAAEALNVMVLAERKEARDTHVLVRGEWDAKGDKVGPGVLPEVLAWPEARTRSRLDLARWLVSPDNPLTARVVVNHLWQMVFGEGLVRTPEDFGLQGELPTHPELLDWLAVELVDGGWDLRRVLRWMVTSAAFRQISGTDEALRERDPENRLLARFSRARLPAWMIRDQALAAAGLLHPLVGGPPVRPWQPPGVWEEIFMGRFTYEPSIGAAQYRRTLYAFWRRSISPTFLFDSAQRRVCEVRTARTNTPLQALTLLNDTTMLEAARALAERATLEKEPARFLGMRVLGRPLAEAEKRVLEREQARALAHYTKHPDEALSYAAAGQQEPPAAGRAPLVASWMVAAGMLFNLDETITHE